MIHTGHLGSTRKQTSGIASALAAARAHHAEGRRSEGEARELCKELTRLFRHYLAKEDRLLFPVWEGSRRQPPAGAEAWRGHRLAPSPGAWLQKPVVPAGL